MAIDTTSSNLVNEMYADILAYRNYVKQADSIELEYKKLLYIKDKRIAQRDSILELDNLIIHKQGKKLAKLNQHYRVVKTGFWVAAGIGIIEFLIIIMR